MTIFKEILGGYAIEKILDKCVSVFTSKGSSVEEQFIYCVNSALISFSKKYVFEYEFDEQKAFFEKLIQQNEILSDRVFIDILKTTVFLEFDEETLKEWLDLLNKTIAEEELTILRDYILIRNSEKQSKNIVYPKILTAKPPLPPEEYLVRKESDIIIDKLKNSKKLVLVNGIGGIGKSTVCRKIFHELNNKGYEHSLAWIVYNDKDLLDDMRKQLFYPKDGSDWEKRIAQFLEQDIDEEAVIFIDNLNVTEEEEKYLPHLANARCNVVCTSRIEKFSHYEIVPIDYMDEEQCIELFYKYYKREYNKERIRNIVMRSGRHTLVLEILGKIGAAERYSLEELENKLIQDGFDLEGIASVENKEDTLIGHLYRTFNFRKLNQTPKEILCCMAVLPVQWIPCDLKRWLNLQNNFNINYLLKYAWIESSENAYYMHPVIKEVVKRGLKISKEPLLQLLKGIGDDISYLENPDIEKSKLYMSFAEAILSFLTGMKNHTISQVAYNIALLYSQFGELEKARKYADYTIEIEEEQRNSEKLLASAYNHRGYINYYSFKDRDAEADYLKAYELRKKLKSQKYIAEITGNLALLYQGMWCELKEEEKKRKKSLLISARKFEKESVQMFEKIFNGVLHPNMASAYNNMAVICYSLEYYDVAIYYYRKAERIRTKLSDTIFPGDLSITYKGLCDSYVQLMEQERKPIRKLVFCKIALDNLNKGLKIRENEIRNGNQKLSVEKMQETKRRLEENYLKLKSIYLL